VLRIPVRLPAGLDRSAPVLRVVPKSPDGFDPFPADLTQNIGASVAIGSRPAVVGRAERLAQRATGSRLARIVSGLRRATDDRHDAVRLLAEGDDVDDPTAGVTVPVPYVIYAGRATTRVR
jgi:hypothetical protein